MYENLVIFSWLAVGGCLIKWYLKFEETKKEITQMSNDEYLDTLIDVIRTQNNSIQF